ncbi:hypothetical protein EYF80_018904 [Liparis tanakae]|uniref:Uncharacterized protein n=1 Tax=Liparis tanakae TaxID=230148 RepID=A0A4Z2HYI6_9TELE|nr:hypothetical protein EYF80_018904 [Liparis tanakae]
MPIAVQPDGERRGEGEEMMTEERKGEKERKEGRRGNVCETTYGCTGMQEEQDLEVSRSRIDQDALSWQPQMELVRTGFVAPNLILIKILEFNALVTVHWRLEEEELPSFVFHHITAVLRETLSEHNTHTPHAADVMVTVITVNTVNTVNTTEGLLVRGLTLERKGGAEAQKARIPPGAGSLSSSRDEVSSGGICPKDWGEDDGKAGEELR